MRLLSPLVNPDPVTLFIENNPNEEVIIE